ncbi:MAG: flippase-like domain-containing protein [Proteobacteria bacterium]|nr:flippase-like domain-containing protein [Pseudomonadota bacterium]
MKILRRRALGIVIGLAITAFFGWLLLSGIDLDKVWEAAAKASVPLLLASIATRILTFGLATARSTIVFSAIKPISWKTQLESLVIAFVGNTVLPFRLGLMMRVAHLSREGDIAPETALGAVGAERLVDVSVLLTLAAVMLPTLTERGATPVAVTGVAVVLAAGVVSAAIVAPRAEELTEHLPDALGRRVLGLFIGIRALGSAKRLIPTVLLSLGFWSAQAMAVLLWLAAFDLPSPLWASGAFLVLVAFGGMIPSGPAFAGPWHYFAALTARLVGADDVQAAAFALVAHFVSFVPLTLVGLVWLWARFVQLLREAE